MRKPGRTVTGSMKNERKKERNMKKAISVLLGTAAAIVLGAFSAAAENIEIPATLAEETSDGISFSISSNKLAASQLKEDSKITVSFTGGEGTESPVKLVLDIWDREKKDDFKFGELVTAEVKASECSDGKAVFTYSDIKTALGEAEPSAVVAMDVAAAGGAAVTCTGVEAENVYSYAEMAGNDISRSLHVHARKPVASENWGQTLTVGVDQFDTSTLTKGSWVIAYFEADTDQELTASPVELILQSTDDKVSPKAKNGTVWAKVAPAMFNNSYAVFDYLSIVDSYGTDDFSCVSTVYVGDTGRCAVTCTDLYVLNIKTIAPEQPEEPVVSEKADESSKQEAVTTTTAADSSKESASEAAAAVSSASSSTAEESSSVSNNIIFIVIGVVAGVVLAVAVIYIVLGRKTKKQYDVYRHRYIKKK